MTSSKRFGFLMLAGLFIAASLSGCGGSSDEKRIPTSVTIFNQHSIVFGNDSSVRTAGYNAFGQLGSGDRDNRAVAGPVPNLGRITGFAAGGAHTLAFTNNSTVMAWGFNQFGQLGSSKVLTGASSSSSDYSDLPVQVDSLRQVTSVAAGLSHSLAVSGGRVFSWGENSFGQLGNGTRSNASVPVEVFQSVTTPFTNPTQVAAGAVHSLVLADGRVWAWGDNELGELGSTIAGATSSVTPIEVIFPGAVPGTVSQIAAAGSFSVARLADGTVWTWGHNQYGQLGRADHVGERLGFVAEPAQVAGLPASVDQIAAGLGHVLARVGGTVWAWGFNEKGQLGNNPVTGTTTSPNSHVPVQMLIGGSESLAGSGTPITGVVNIQAFGNSSLATLRSSTGKVEIWGWGENSFGQLGAENPKNGAGFRTVPVPMQGL
jgi:alpha-tubulin suppressor-like RCC1 family protein